MRRRTHQRLWRFVQDVREHTPFAAMILLLLASWLLFSGAVYLIERQDGASPINELGEALYWGVAAFSTAGIADAPQTPTGRAIAAVWMTLGSLLYFGAIVSTATAYFMRPMQRPGKQIIDTIEYNLEQLDDLSVEELELLKSTVDNLIEHMERRLGTT